jgi:hypothetical protein
MNTTSSRISNRRPAGGQQNRRPAQHGAASASKRYHRYCVQCGWGFTYGQFQNVCFCPRCGVQVKATAAHQPGFRSPGKAARWGSRTADGIGAAPRGSQSKPVMRGAVRPRNQLSRMSAAPQPNTSRVERLTRFASESPARAGLASAAVGITFMVAGSALVAAGNAVAIGGGVLAVASSFGALLAAKHPQAAIMGMKGAALGLAGVIGGSVISMAGQGLMVAGTVVLAGSTLLTCYGVAKHLSKARQASFELPNPPSRLLPGT